MTIEELFAAVLGVPVGEVTDDMAARDRAEWTSRAHIQLVVALEDLYRVSLSTAEIREMTSVGAAKGLLAGKGVAVA